MTPGVCALGATETVVCGQGWATTEHSGAFGLEVNLGLNLGPTFQLCFLGEGNSGLKISSIKISQG